MTYTIYTKPGCGYCTAAVNLLTSLGLEYKEIHINIGQPEQPGLEYIPLDVFKEKFPFAKTVPQIFKGEEHVGGYTELAKQLGE